jgi:hypothetical protein
MSLSFHGRKTDKVCSVDCRNRQDLRSDVILCSTAGGNNLYFSIPFAFLDFSIMFLDRLGKYLK